MDLVLKESLEFCNIMGKNVFTDSLKVAKTFGKEHRNVLKTINRVSAQNEAVLKMFRKFTYVNKQNKSLPAFYMTRDGFTLLVMGFTGKNALEFKLAYMNAFNDMEKRLSNQNIDDWNTARKQGIVFRRELTDNIQSFIEYSENQGGGKGTKFYYSNITKMTYKALGLISNNEKITKDFRQMLDSMDLAFIGQAETIAQESLAYGMKEGLHYKDIYQLAKQNVVEYCKTILIMNTKRIEIKKKLEI